MWVCRPDPWDQLTLCPRTGCSCWTRRPWWGGALFGFLEPGEYLLTLRRGTLCCRLLLRLPPGANVDVALDMENRTWSWRRDLFHCFYNQK